MEENERVRERVRQAKEAQEAKEHARMQARMDYYKYQSPLVSKILDEIVSHMNEWKEDAKMGFGGVDCRHYIGLRLGKESDYLSDAILIDTNDRDEGLLFRKWGFESVDKKDKEMFVDALVQRLRQLAAEEFPLVQVGEASEMIMSKDNLSLSLGGR